MLEISEALGEWSCPAERMQTAQTLYADWNKEVDAGQVHTNSGLPSYAQVVGVVNKQANPEDTMVTRRRRVARRNNQELAM